MIHAVIFKCACYYSKADRVCHPTKLGGHGLNGSMKVKLGFGIGTLVMKMAGRSLRQLYVPQLRMVRSQNFGLLLRSMAFAQRTSRRRSTKSRKKCTVQKVIENNFGVNQIDVQNGFYMERIYFVILWELVSSVHLDRKSLTTSNVS
jgi:hypothetical protein